MGHTTESERELKHVTKLMSARTIHDPGASPTYVSDIRELLDHLASQADGSSDRLDLNPDRDREMEPVKRSEEEFNQQAVRRKVQDKSQSIAAHGRLAILTGCSCSWNQGGCCRQIGRRKRPQSYSSCRKEGEGE